MRELGHVLEWAFFRAAYPFAFNAGAFLFWLPFVFAWRHFSAYWLYRGTPSRRAGIGYWTWLGLQARVQPQPEVSYYESRSREAARRKAVLAGEIDPCPNAPYSTSKQRTEELLASIYAEVNLSPEPVAPAGNG